MAAQTAHTPADTPFDPIEVADDLDEVRHLYAELFATFDLSRWDDPVKRGRNEWTLHETIAHLCALNGAGLEGIKHTLRYTPYTFEGLDTRYQLSGYNRKGIDDHLSVPTGALCAEFLNVHRQAAEIARGLQLNDAQLTFAMSIYNRPVQVIEALNIIVMHAGLVHTAQVAEPAGIPPLWKRLSPQVRHRQIARMMRALSLLYRADIGGALRASLVFQVDGPGGGVWHVDVAPDGGTAERGDAAHPTVTICFAATDDFCRMMTGRLNLLAALATRRLRLRGDRRLFLHMNRLFSADAKPKGAR